MVNARAIARLGTLAVGLGIGVAVASTPGVAVADSSADWLGDLFGGVALPAPAVPDLDLAISIDGYSLVSEGTASADSGSGDIAIAYGDGAYASAEGGNGDFALADGSDALARSGGLSTDTGANDDTAIDIGNNSGFFDNDASVDVGNNTGDVDGPWTVAGNDNYASSFGDDTSDGEGSVASDGDSNIAEVVGPNTYAFADAGNSNIAYVFDPFGTGAGSEADAGVYGNFDLSAVFGDGLTSTSATGGAHNGGRGPGDE